jgi:hypothetical protein
MASRSRIVVLTWLGRVGQVENEDTSDLRKEINFLKGCASDTIVAYKGSYVKDNQIWVRACESRERRAGEGLGWSTQVD